MKVELTDIDKIIPYINTTEKVDQGPDRYLGISRFQNFKANLLRFEILNQNGALSDFCNDISMLIFGQCCIHSIRNFYQGFKGNEEKN